MITIRGQILVTRTGDDPLFPLPFLLRVCIRNVPLVYVRNVPVCTGTTPACVITCGRGAGTHGGVLNVHTEVFLNVHTGTPHTPHNTDRETQRQRQTDTERQRETERDRERDTKQDKKRKEKTIKEKKREDEKGETRR